MYTKYSFKNFISKYFIINKVFVLLLVSFAISLKGKSQELIQGFPLPEFYRNFEYGNTELEKYESKAAALYKIGSVVRLLQGVSNNKDLNTNLRKAVDQYADLAEKIHDEYIARSKSDISVDQWLADVKNIRDNDEVFQEKLVQTLDGSVQSAWRQKKSQLNYYKESKQTVTEQYPLYEMLAMFVLAGALILFRNRIF